MTDVLITGAAGFLGREIVREAAVAGLSVQAVDLKGFQFGAPVEYSKADILDPAGLRRAMTGPAAAIHAAGLAHRFGRHRPDPGEFCRINENGTANVAKAAIEGCPDTWSGQLGCPYTAEVHPAAPTSRAARCLLEPYAESKWRAEQRAREITSRAGVRLTILRLATLYGEGDPEAILAA